MNTPSRPDRHAQQRGFIEGVLRYIPGFHGYLEKEYRRESDHMMRTWMADRLTQAKSGLDDYGNTLLSSGYLDAMTDIDRIRSRLDGLINSLKGAVRGYSGFFDFVKVDQGLLERVYEHDVALAEDVDGLANSLETLNQKTEPPNAVAAAVLKHIDEISRKFSVRGDMLNGLGPE